MMGQQSPLRFVPETSTMTAPSPTDKIVDLTARAGAARGEANPMLATIRSRALKRLSALAAEVLEKADDTLFDFV